ncbi:large subunit ribosomal protein L17 [Porphyromonadaceae bacterium KH3R12]|nr:50S ribosomal protein L17 [Proteiniphilum saccharofermentans]SEA01069.1 large subunit ribosomal protein L17 [Porphyromonadaceae bacterium KH3R12]
MRHNKKNNHLGRKTAHRSAMLSNMASSLIMHKRIFTTVPKAKELRKYVEPLITKSKEDTTHSRREVFSKLQSKTAVTELFQTVSQKVGDRPGGYTRIIKTGFRLGDNASMCFIELVDFNENMLSDGKAKKAKTRRSRRKASDAPVAAATGDAPKAKKAKEEVKEAEESVKEEVSTQPAEEKTEEVVNEQEATETPADDMTEKSEEGK